MQYEVICDETNNPMLNIQSPFPTYSVPRRGYVFVHRGISGIYAGIQLAHALARLVHDQYANTDMIEWIQNHETLVALDGGNSDNMNQIMGILYGADNVFASFNEPDMNNMVTAIAYVPSEDEMLDIEFYKNNKELIPTNPVIDLLIKTRTHKG